MAKVATEYRMIKCACCGRKFAFRYDYVEHVYNVQNSIVEPRSMTISERLKDAM